MTVLLSHKPLMAHAVDVFHLVGHSLFWAPPLSLLPLDVPSPFVLPTLPLVSSICKFNGCVFHLGPVPIVFFKVPNICAALF